MNRCVKLNMEVLDFLLLLPVPLLPTQAQLLPRPLPPPQLARLVLPLPLLLLMVPLGQRLIPSS
jgi:hypothetical protein